MKRSRSPPPRRGGGARAAEEGAGGARQKRQRLHAVQWLVSAAVPVVVRDTPTSGYRVPEEAAAVLRGLEAPVRVLCIAGPYRSGKSTLLEVGTGGKSVFDVGHTNNSCTRGIRMAPFVVPGVPGSWVLLDTEGFSSLEADRNHDITIFALSLLFASRFIYNTVGKIDEDALGNLSMVTHLGLKIFRGAAAAAAAADAGTGPGTGAPEIDAAGCGSAPDFVWLLRDFTLNLATPDGRPMTPDEYLERAWAQLPDLPEQSEKNLARVQLRQMFPTPRCLTLVRPCVEESDIHRLSTGKAPLRETFVQQVRAAWEDFLSPRETQPKRIFGRLATGAMLAHLWTAFVEQINAGKIPSAQGFFSTMGEQSCQAALREAQAAVLLEWSRTEGVRMTVTLLAAADAPEEAERAAIEAAADSGATTSADSVVRRPQYQPPPDLRRRLEGLLRKAEAEFLQRGDRLFGSDAVVEATLAEWRTWSERLLRVSLAANMLRLRRRIAKIVSEHLDGIVVDEALLAEDIFRAVDAAHREFRKRVAHDEDSEHAWKVAVAESYPRWFSVLSERQRAIVASLTQERDQLSGRIADFEGQAVRWEGLEASMREQQQAATERERQLSEELHRAKTACQEAQHRVSLLEAEVTRLQERHDTTNTTLESLRAEAAENAALRGKLSSKEAALREAEGELQTQHTEMRRRLQETSRRVTEQVDQLRAEVDRLTLELQTCRRQLEEARKAAEVARQEAVAAQSARQETERQRVEAAQVHLVQRREMELTVAHLRKAAEDAEDLRKRLLVAERSEAVVRAELEQERRAVQRVDADAERLRRALDNREAHIAKLQEEKRKLEKVNNGLDFELGLLRVNRSLDSSSSSGTR